MISDVEQKPPFHDPIGDLFDTSNKFRAENENIGFREIQAVFDLIGRKTEGHRNGDRAGFQNPEINREPFDPVHQKNCDLISFSDPAGEEQV